MKTTNKSDLNKRLYIVMGFMLGLMAAAMLLVITAFASSEKSKDKPNSKAVETIEGSQMTYTTIATPQIAPEPCFISEKEGYRHETVEKGYCVVCKKLVELRYGFTEDEVYLLTQLLCGSKNISGDGEYDFDYWLQIGSELTEKRMYQIYLVLDVVMNRVMAEGVYADNVYDVLMQKGAFAVFPKNLKATPEPLAVEVVREWCTLYDSWDSETQVIPEDHFWFSSAGGNTNRSRNHWR